MVEGNARHSIKKEERKEKRRKRGKEESDRDENEREERERAKERENEGMTRLVERMGRVAGRLLRFVDESRSRPEIFIIPFKNLHREIGLTSCRDVVTSPVRRRTLRATLFSRMAPAASGQPSFSIQFFDRACSKSTTNRAIIKL